MSRRRSRVHHAAGEGAELFEGISDVSLSLLKIFILLVFFLLLKASVEIFQNILPNQFTGRGGQPHLRLFVTTDPAVPGCAGIRFLVDNDQGRLALSWPQLQSVFSHINKREFVSTEPGAKRLASLTYIINRAPDRGAAELRTDLAQRTGLVANADTGMSPQDLVACLNRANPARTHDILAYKRRFTFDDHDPDQGRNHQESIDSDQPQSFDWVPIAQRLGRRPYLWFTVDPDGRIPFGPTGPDQVRLTTHEFQMLLDGFRGNDGFYVEYRATPDQRGPGAEPPATVAAVLKEAGFLDRVVRQDKLDIHAAMPVAKP